MISTYMTFWRRVPGLIPFLFVCGLLAAAPATGDLSKYRGIAFGSELSAVAGQIGTSVSQAKVIYSRPALIQELAWRPQGLGPSTIKESVNEVILTFYNGALYRIAVNYDRYETEGLTAEDIIDSISNVYGPAVKQEVSVKASADRYDNQDQVVARWHDGRCSFSLVRSPYGPSFKLVGVLERLDSSAGAAISEAKRLDAQEAPQRDAALAAKEKASTQSRLESLRTANKLRFRP